MSYWLNAHRFDGATAVEAVLKCLSGQAKFARLSLLLYLDVPPGQSFLQGVQPDL